MGKIANMRNAYNSISPNISVDEIFKIAGMPDSVVGTYYDGILTWQDSVWKGIFRGGIVYRKLIVFTKGGKIVQYSSENLNVSSW